MNVTTVSPLKKLHYMTKASTNATSVTSVPTQVYGIGLWSTVTCYFKLYDKATAPVVGTDVPFMTAQVPANVPQHIIYGVNPRSLKNGLAFAVTLNAPDADATVLAGADTSGIELSYSPNNANP